MNIIIPCAGSGTRFLKAGMLLPKFLLPVLGKPMIEWTLNSIKIRGHYIFMCRDEHISQFGLTALFKELAQKNKCSFEIVSDDGKSQGCAPAILKTKHRIDNNQKVMVVNNDQAWDYSSIDFLKFLQSKRANGAVLTFTNDNPQWSYVVTDNENQILKIVEKQVVSNQANVGVYAWEHGCDMIWSIEQMIKDNTKMVNNEFYLAPSINELINIGQRFYAYNVDAMFPMGTPSDLVLTEKKLSKYV